MKFHFSLLAFVLNEGAEAFQTPQRHSMLAKSTALFGKTRKAKRIQNVEKQTKGRSQAFYDAIRDAQDIPVEKKEQVEGGPRPPIDDEDEARRQAQMAAAEARMQARPEVSTMVVDEETGIEVISQGQSVLDIVTRKAVKLSDRGPDERFAQMFPSVSAETRKKHRLSSSTPVMEIVERLREACSVKLEDGSRGIPPSPSLAQSGIDFVISNRDLLGDRMSSTLGRLTMKAASEGKDAEATELNKLWQNFLALENYISAPFRQIIQDAEGRVGPNFGNLELTKYCGKDLYERVGDYIVLKGMVAHWEKKVVDANYYENTPQKRENYMSVLGRGDPRRYLPTPPILFTLKECTQVCAMAQKMCQLFIQTEELYADFPAEIVFLEDALKVKGGAALRKYMVDEFCPARGISPEILRESMMRLNQQLGNMQLDPYGDLTKKVGALYAAMAVGTDDEKDPYSVVNASFKPGDPGFFQTYTFDYPKSSLVRFLDGQYPSAGDVDIFSLKNEKVEEEETSDGGVSTKDDHFLSISCYFDLRTFLLTFLLQFDLGGLFNLGGGDTKGKNLRSEPKPENYEKYDVPQERKMNRPHNLGWFENLNKQDGPKVRLGQVPPGRIIPDE